MLHSFHSYQISSVLFSYILYIGPTVLCKLQSFQVEHEKELLAETHFGI